MHINLEGARKCLALDLAQKGLLRHARRIPSLAFSSSSSPPPPPPTQDGENDGRREGPAFDAFFRSVLGRAQSKIDEGYETFKPGSNEFLASQANFGGDTLLKSACNRAQMSIDRRRSFSGGSTAVDVSSQILDSVAEYSSEAAQESDQKPSDFSEEAPAKKQTYRYRANPAITNTALAHVLWGAVIDPNVDTVIDATCGNGYDSIALARMLFAGDADKCEARLMCIDIQKQACEATRLVLSKELSAKPEIVENNVQVLHIPHAPLPRPNDSSSVGLVCYNLGFLPGSDKSAMTQTDTTLDSITDAILLIRVGGMVSCMTYPRTNLEEDLAVRLLMESVALLSSNRLSWEEFLEEQEDVSERILSMVAKSMQRIQRQGDPGMSFRASQHSRLGADKPPTLLTTIRIK